MDKMMMVKIGQNQPIYVFTHQLLVPLFRAVLRILDRKAIGLVFLMGALMAGLEGCGQSGPLYLPGTPPPVKVPSCKECP